MPNLPEYLVEAIVRYGAECRAQAQAELRGQMASLLGLSQAKPEPSLVSAAPTRHYGGGEAVPIVEAVQQNYAYGTIGKVVKQIMREAPRTGIEISDIIKRAARDWKTPITKPQARDALKRMKADEEVLCEGRRKWIPTPKLRGEEAPNENEAPSGETAGASKTEGAATPSTFENVFGFGQPR